MSTDKKPCSQIGLCTENKPQGLDYWHQKAIQLLQTVPKKASAAMCPNERHGSVQQLGAGLKYTANITKQNFKQGDKCSKASHVTASHLARARPKVPKVKSKTA